MRIRDGFVFVLTSILLAAFSLEANAQDFTVDNPVLVSKTRVSRTQFDFTYQVDVTNIGPDATNVVGTVVSTSANTQVIDGEVSFGGVLSGATVTGGDTYTIRQDRRFPFDPTALVWTIVSDSALESVSAIIGTGGGSIALSDGASVEIPPGALAGDVTITISEITPPPSATFPDASGIAGKVYTLEPTGQMFTTPVAVTLPYDALSIPPDFAEDSAGIYVQDSNGRFELVPSQTADDFPESDNQILDLTTKQITVQTDGFSTYTVLVSNVSTTFTEQQIPVVQAGTTVSRLGIFRAPSFRTTKVDPTLTKPGNVCIVSTAAFNAGNFSVPIPTRPAAIAGIILHSTNNPRASFDRELAYALSSRNNCFAHYYLDREGRIFQISEDNRATIHTRTGQFSNDNAIGIELFNQQGEPYDGRQIAALVRLLDYLTLQHQIIRPQRDPITGVVVRNPAMDTVITHSENDNRKIDPIGTFQSSSQVTFLSIVNRQVQVSTRALPGGSVTAPAMVDAIVDTLAAMDRNAQDTGVINTSGGDSSGSVDPGDGGAVSITEDVSVALPALTQQTNNTPLIIAEGATMSLSGVQQFTDAIIGGTLDVSGDLDLRLSGTMYLAPRGKILLRNVNNGGDFTLTINGIPVLQGLVDATGVRGGTTVMLTGGAGGTASITSTASGPFLVPTIITRGGDRNLTTSNGMGAGGNGGAITVNVGSSHLLLGGGANAAGDPDFRDGIDPTLPEPPIYIGDELPPPPPGNLGSIASTVTPGQPTPLRTAGFQVGFTRGLLTSGGLGGSAEGDAAGGDPLIFNGGPGGNGGNVSLSVDPANGLVTFRDIDLITGADAEMVFTDLFFPESIFPLGYFAPNGSLGGRGGSRNVPRGGDGGQGGNAGSITVNGNLQPLPVSFAPVGGIGGTGDILGFDNGLPPAFFDDAFGFTIGTTIQAGNGLGRNLYRVRVDDTGMALVGGSGGLPGNGIGIFTFSPGAPGAKGASGMAVGLPLR